MHRIVTINVDEDLLALTADSFGFQNRTNYSQLVEQVLLYFLKPQIKYKKSIEFVDKEIEELLVEPLMDIVTIEKDYSFDLEAIEGKWPGNESVEQLIQMLSK